MLCVHELNAQRTENLGMSGPTFQAIGGPGPHFIKYNSNPDAGSAVRQGLMPQAMVRIDFYSDGHIRPHRDQPMLDTAGKTRWEAAWQKVWNNTTKR